MGFRHRLALFLVVTLVAVQTLTAFFVYEYVRRDMLRKAEHELTAELGQFTRQLNLLSERVADSVNVLSLDYALRAAIAKEDYDTELSALRNHGQRIGAARMVLVRLDGRILVDTTYSGSRASIFPFPSLLQSAAVTNSGAGLTAFFGKVYWTVVAPVRAPVPIAFIGAFIPVDNALLGKLRGIAALPHSVALATKTINGNWIIAVESGVSARAMWVPPAELTRSAATRVTNANGREYLSVMGTLATARESTPVVALMGYPLDDALGVSRALISAMLAAPILALLVALAATMFIVRGVSRPLEALARAARRIAAGDYTPPPQFRQRDEVGHLAEALHNMTQSIAEREGALKGAIQSIEATRAEAVRANEAKSQFLTNMSHEFRTPLNAILGFGEMLEQQTLGPIGVTRYRDYAHNICDSGRQLLGMIERILDLGEAEAGRLSLKRATIFPGSLICESAVLLQSLCREMQVRLVVPDTASWPSMEGDSARLRQAFFNLIHNAIKYSSQGGEVRILGKVGDHRLCIRIEDEGVGIAPELLPIVVRPFHRLRSALDGRQQGAGVGLPFAKTMIELHGGTLRINSAPNCGTTVLVELPLSSEPARQAA